MASFSAKSPMHPWTLLAEKEKMAREGEGKKLHMVSEAEGILAKGKAEAEARRLLLKAYGGEGGRRYTEIKKAEALGAGIEKIYYVPSDMGINAIAKDLQGAVTIGLPNNNKATNKNQK